MANHNLLIGKPTINGPFSIAKFNYQRVTINHQLPKIGVATNPPVEPVSGTGKSQLPEIIGGNKNAGLILIMKFMIGPFRQYSLAINCGI